MKYYIWVGESCDNETTDLEQAQAWAREFVDVDGFPSAYVVDENDKAVFDYAKARTQFEVTCAGFDGDDDRTDDRVLWVLAACQEEIEDLVAGAGVISVVPMHANVDEPYTDDVYAMDFILPNAAEAFLAKCKEFQSSAG